MASDNFDRADAANLGANWFNQLGSIDIFSNKARSASASSEIAHYSAETFPDDQYSQVVASGVSGSYNAVTARASVAVVASVSGNLYVVLWSASGGSQGLYKMVSGASVLLQSITGSLVADDVIRIEVIGSTIRCLKNGIQLGSDTVDASLASGSPGIYSVQDGGLNITFNDWEGGALVTTKRFCLIPN